MTSPPPTPSVAPSAPHRHIHARGTPEDAWQAGRVLPGIRPVATDALVPAGARVVVMAPHPDDEILAIGGLLATLARRAVPIRILAITDGTASHPASAWFTPDRLAELRPRETAAALRELGIDPDDAIDRCGIPDGQVAANVDALRAWMHTRLTPDDVLFVPSPIDGHPDHEACARAARPFADTVARCVECPIWLWHWASPDGDDLDWTHARRIDLDDDALARKNAAIACFTSQTGPDPSDPLAAPVLPDWALARWTRRYETVFTGTPT